MNPILLINMFEFALVVTASLLILISIAASAYDFKLISLRKRLRGAERRLRHPRQPSVTVLVYCYNNQKTIQSCLASLARSRYRNFDVVVVDNKSSDSARSIIRRFTVSCDMPIRLFAKRKFSSRKDALMSGYQKSKKGDYVIVIGADTVVSSGFIKQSIAYFIAKPGLNALRFGEFTTQPDSLHSMLLRYYQFSRNIVIKACSAIGIRQSCGGSLNVMYRIDRANVRKNYLTTTRFSYGPLVDKSGQEMASSVVGAVLAFVLVLVVSYFMYLAASLQNNSLLLVSWTLFVIWLLVTMWLDSSTTRAQKMRMSIFVPSIYFIGYVQLLIILLSKINRKIINN